MARPVCIRKLSVPRRSGRAFGTDAMKQLWRILLAGGVGLAACGIVGLITANRAPGTADEEGGTDPFYLALVERAWWAIFCGAISLSIALYCWKRGRRNL